MVYSASSKAPSSGIAAAISRERDADERELGSEPAHVVAAAVGDVDEPARVKFAVPVGVIGPARLFVGLEQQLGLGPRTGQRRRGADDDAVRERLRVDYSVSLEVLVEG